MLKSRFFAYVFIVCSLALSACFSPWSGEEQGEMANISINLGGGTARSTGFCGTINPADISYELWLLDDSNNRIREITVNTNGRANANVNPGTYFIEVDAFIRGWDYAESVYGPFTITA